MSQEEELSNACILILKIERNKTILSFFIFKIQNARYLSFFYFQRIPTPFDPV